MRLFRATDKRSITSILMIALWITFLPGLSDAQTIGEEKDVAEILALVKSAQDAYVERDWDRFTDHFTQDALWMPNNSLLLKGKSAWWSFSEGFWSTTEVISMDMQTEEVVVYGDWAFERHTRATELIQDSQQFRSRSKGIYILKRTQDGSWKIARNIWNGNPAPPN